MTDIAILRDGTPVRLSSFKDPIFDVSGFLIQFTFDSLIPETYRYHQHYEFKREDRKKPNLSGYYNEKLFLNYIQNIEPIPTLDKLDKYNFKRNLATEDEEITVSTIDFDEPYDYFYNEKKYTFKLKNTLDNKGVRNYLQPIVENFRTVDSKINTDGANPVIVLNNQSGLPGGYFYKKNLGDFINTWSISNIQKSLIKKAMGMIIFKIREINRDIIPRIASHTHFFDKEEDVANGIIDYNDPTHGFTDLEKLLFDLKRGWGYYYRETNQDLTPLRASFDAVFSSTSTYEDYLSYLSNLHNFYDKCYSTKSLEYYRTSEKLQFLLEILSPSALSILPYDLIISTIKKYLKINLEQEEQQFLVRLVISVTPSHANDFLDFLLEKENGEKTNFQAIYDSLTDARLERYPFVNWFVDEQPNRKYFAFAIYELWKISKYNLDYIRPGIVIPNPWPNFKGIDPENYFYINSQEFNKKSWLTFVSSSNDNDLFTFKEQFFESTITDKKIKINKINKNLTVVDTWSVRDKDKESFFGSFHLYQQVTFSGYEANLDLSIPTTATMPAFLFHFITEYDELADFDAGVALAANLTVDALLIYFTGGSNILSDLQYLKHTTKIGRALAGGIEPTEAIEIWRGFRGASDIFTLTAGSLTQINQYLITTENNEAKRKILEGCQKIFISLTFLGVGLSLTAQAHAVSEAEKVLDLIKALPSGVAHGLAPEMINLLTTLKGNKEVTLTLFGNKLNTLDLGNATNYILLKYNSVFTDAQRLKFMTDFQHIDDLAFWRLLNNGRNASGIRDGSFINNWVILSERELQEAKFTDYICNQKMTNARIRFNNQPALEPIIKNINYEKRYAFLNKYGLPQDFSEIKFSKCIQQPKKLELLIESGSYLKRGQLDELLEEDILKIIDSNLSNAHIDLLRIKNKNNLGQIVFNFEEQIKNINLDLNRLRALRDGTAFSFMQDLILNPKQIKNFQSMNKLFVETKIYNNTNLINTFEETYLAGWKKFIEDVFNNNIPNSITEPGNNASFNIFKQKAIDIINKRKRYDDTELKYVFNFLEKHWNKGNRFEITMESTYYSCQSCQGYMLYLKQLAKQEGKVLNITIKSNKKVKDYKTLEEILLNN
ncbi:MULTISPECIES: hypothetical protein [Flavobacterium]|uniref:hypothetical protein n=1 Tax=Flavobacterium TaxID=237 RepID=UPI0021147496|nr:MULTISPECIES: hypothetical protein [Flavobacterium]UUF16658.1 hypothetical protein NLJ00_11200 [Flavobacterium panici]